MTELLPLTPDELLTTTRAVRKRLDLERPGRRDVVEECIEIALQAPSGSNRQAWQWIPVDDPATKAGIAELYRQVFDSYQPRSSGYVEGDTRSRAARRRDGVVGPPARPPPRGPGAARRLPGGPHRGAAARLAPRLLGLGRAGDLELHAGPRARGLGSVWTTMTCRTEQEMAELLGVRHDEYTQIGLFPVAYTIGTDFKPAPRLDPASVIHWNRW